MGTTVILKSSFKNIRYYNCKNVGMCNGLLLGQIFAALKRKIEKYLFIK
jgi:hypothetical protein